MVVDPTKPWYMLTREEQAEEAERLLTQPQTRGREFDIMTALVLLERDPKIRARLKHGLDRTNRRAAEKEAAQSA